MITSKNMQEYFNNLEKDTQKLVELGKIARKKGFDPTSKVEVPLATDLAARVEGLISSIYEGLQDSGLAKRIRELEEKYGKNDEHVAIISAEETASEKFCKFKNLEEALDAGLRVGVAYTTLGIVTAPLEGISQLKIKKRQDGKEYVAVYFAGPIRSAGGTANAFAVFIADYLRMKFNLEPYDPTDDEIERFVIELDDYDSKITNLQYRPYPEEIRFLVKNVPVEIAGVPTERLEVLSFKNLPRVDTNKIRSGVCLTLSMVGGKASKLNKKITKKLKEYSFDSWVFLDKYMKMQKELHSKSDGDKKDKGDDTPKIVPSYKYMTELPGGRPVFSYPSRPGGFRLRYGRSRNTGFAANGMHPATMILCDDFIAVGTQLKIERPGKATVAMPVDSIRGPVVKLDNGNVVEVNDIELANAVKNNVEEVLFLGDILIGFGEFLTNGKPLDPAPWCEEWWEKLVQKKLLELNKFNLNENKNSNNTQNLDTFSREENTNLKKSTLENVDNKNNNYFEKPPLSLFNRKIKFSENYSACIDSLSYNEAKTISLAFNTPLHPGYTYFYNNVSLQNIKDAITWFSSGKVEFGKDDNSPDANILSLLDKDKQSSILEKFSGKKQIKYVKIPFDKKMKRIFEIMCVPHIVEDNYVVFSEAAFPIIDSFSIIVKEDNSLDCSSFLTVIDNILGNSEDDNKIDTLTVINKTSIYTVENLCRSFIGTRMGRPEKAERRLMAGKPHLLFPVGRDTSQQKKQRSLVKAASFEKVKVDISHYYCNHCANITYYRMCPVCNNETEIRYFCRKCFKLVSDKTCNSCGSEAQLYKSSNVEVGKLIKTACDKLNLVYPKVLKGVQGMTSSKKIPERVEKGLLRSKYSVNVNKDGTIRFDGTDCPFTYFKPSEIGTTVEKLIELGYTFDYLGNKLEHPDQILELKPQDFIISDFQDPEGAIASGADYLVNVCKFIDDELTLLYEMDAFYNVKTREDLVGHLMITLAPHTSAGIVGRIIGFTPARVFYCHPMLIAARRRNADGDEDSMMMALDTLLNFSREFLADTAGAKTMDVPLVLTTLLNPSEIDDEVWDMDCVWEYPLEFYEKSLTFPGSWELEIETLGDRIKKESFTQYEFFGFTVNTDSIHSGPTITAYKKLDTMLDKVMAQLNLEKKITSVDQDDVAQIILSTHFLKDIKGNMRTFSQQKVRCISCNNSYRRVPLAGKCLNPKCGGKLVLTVHQGTVEKYLKPSLQISEAFNLPLYTTQQLELSRFRSVSMFGKEKYQQKGLNSFFGSE